MKRFISIITALTLLGLNIPVVAYAAPPPVIRESVGVCDYNSPTHCAAPNSDGSVNVKVTGGTGTSVTQGTSPWVVSGTVASNQSGQATDVALSGTNPATLTTYDNSTTNYTTAALNFSAIGSGSFLLVKCAPDGVTYITLTGLGDGSSAGTVVSPTLNVLSVYRYNVTGCKSIQVATTSGSGTVTGNLRLTYGVAQPGLLGTLTAITGTVNTASVSAGTSITASSGNVANASAVATLAGVSSKTTYITGFQCTAAGATAASVVTSTVSGTISGTMSYTFIFPTGVTTLATPLIVTFANPVPASALNTSIVVTLPAGGSGNTNATCSAQGFQL